MKSKIYNPKLFSIAFGTNHLISNTLIVSFITKPIMAAKKRTIINCHQGKGVNPGIPMIAKVVPIKMSKSKAKLSALLGFDRQKLLRSLIEIIEKTAI